MKSAASGLWRMLREREWNGVISALGPVEGVPVLELGCGAGFYARRLHGMGARVTAVDSSPAMLSGLGASGIETVLCAAERFDPPRRFKNVLAAGLLEFVSEPQAVFSCARKALEPGGRFVILIPTSGLIGKIYSASHECPVFIRTVEEYSTLALRESLTLTQVTQVTRSSLLSRVLGFDLV